VKRPLFEGDLGGGADDDLGAVVVADLSHYFYGPVHVVAGGDNAFFLEKYKVRVEDNDLDAFGERHVHCVLVPVDVDHFSPYSHEFIYIGCRLTCRDRLILTPKPPIGPDRFFLGCHQFFDVFYAGAERIHGRIALTQKLRIYHDAINIHIRKPPAVLVFFFVVEFKSHLPGVDKIPVIVLGFFGIFLGSILPA